MYKRQALTHSSYANDLRAKELPCNERLEFLGDSVLNLVTAEYLFTKFSHRSEGELTKARASIICEASCHEIAEELSLGRFLYLGRGEEQSGGRQRVSTLADALEAVVAALYLDAGLEEARRFLTPFIEKRVHAVMQELFFKDYKTALQEIVQKNKQETLKYVLTGESGPAHAKHFTVTLYLNSKMCIRDRLTSSGIESSDQCCRCAANERKPDAAESPAHAHRSKSRTAAAVHTCGRSERRARYARKTSAAPRAP